MAVTDEKGRKLWVTGPHAAKHIPGGSDPMRWTADKILKGAGAGSDPTLIDVPTAVPSGLIAMWHGTIANIPAGWVICDGNNSTPNLLAKFVQGVATAVTDPGATGGATSKTTAGHSTPGHTLTEAQIPAHTHTYKHANTTGGENDVAARGAGVQRNVAVSSTGGGGAHTHGNVTDSITDIRPLFYDVAFIMKS